MAKPFPPVTPPGHQSLICWHVSLGGDEFDVEGVTLAEALKLFDKWNGERGGGTSDQPAVDALARTLDTETRDLSQSVTDNTP